MTVPCRLDRKDPKVKEIIATKFQAEFVDKSWPPTRSHQERTWLLLESMLHEEAEIAFEQKGYTNLMNEARVAARQSYSTTCAYEHYIKASNYFFNMIEQGIAVNVDDNIMIMGLDGRYIFADDY